MSLIAAALSLLAGCGGAQSNSAQVRAVVKRYQAALVDRDGSEMCSLLSSDAKHELPILTPSPTARGGPASGCLRFAKRLDELPIDQKVSARIREAKIGAPKVAGGRATVLVREPGESARELTLVKTSTGWKIGLPPPTTTPTFDLRGEPAISVEPPPAVAHAGGETLAQFNLGRRVAADSGCLACHLIGQAGNNGPGPDLTQVGSRLPVPAIERTLADPTAPMPSFRRLPRAEFHAVVTFLSLLRE